MASVYCVVYRVILYYAHIYDVQCRAGLYLPGVCCVVCSV